MTLPPRAVVIAAAGGLLAAGIIPLVAGARAGRGSFADGPAPAPPSGHAVVVAELFTSEGCSSCPPADAVLRKLVGEQPLANVEVAGLGEHVDYWDNLGWRDPYSSAGFSQRQSQYSARVFHGGSIYTPQIVIDGRYEAVGSDVAAVRAAIVKAAAAQKVGVRVAASPEGDGQIRVRVALDPPPGYRLPERADVVVALAEDGITDDVTRGENSGRRLTHSAVVHSLTSIGSIAGPDATFTADTTLSRGRRWKLDALRVVGFLQARDSRTILGAGSAAVGHPTTKETSR